MSFQLSRRQKVFSLLAFGLLLLWWFCLPAKLFTDPYATVVLSREGELLSATIASDGQWRFPQQDSVPHKFEQAILHFEDEYFYRHPGVNPVSTLRALQQNISAGEVVSGGSTITMQVIRMSRKGQARTITEKVIESWMATRLELRYSKEEILQLYAAHAPFGGNVVGLPAASWRYFGRSPQNLSWAEASMLAVLPNQPGLVHPGRNREVLLNKRNRLLDKLREKGVIDSLTHYLSLLEDLPAQPYPLPQKSLHLLTRGIRDGHTGRTLQTSIKADLQSQVSDILARHGAQLRLQGIHNAAAVVIDVETGEALAYVGNIPGDRTGENGHAVDVIPAPRSSGSILKPLLFASMLHEGTLLPGTLVQDVPTYMNGFNPQNYNKTFDGAVPARQALSRSLNVPSVYMLREYSVEKFHYKLNQLGLTTVKRPAANYGLSLILGGAEVSLWDITAVYAGMARTLNHYFAYPGLNNFYSHSDYIPNSYRPRELTPLDAREYTDAPYLEAGAIWHTFEAMAEVNRPELEGQWERYSSSQKIAWKTGTSYGFRDAWSVGVTSRYVVGVWTGNADGEGRPGLVGLHAAAPILFDIFKRLDRSPWFEKPLPSLSEVTVCRYSGHRASAICAPVDTLAIPLAGLRTTACTYHQQVHFHPTENLQVSSSCMAVDAMRHESRFVLPPAMEWYYKSSHAHYKPLPPFAPGCDPDATAQKAMQVIYPDENSRIIIPVELEGDRGRAVFEVAHREPATEIHWHVDERYLGSTKRIHQMEIDSGPGDHVLTLVDEFGETKTLDFAVIRRKKDGQ